MPIDLKRIFRRPKFLDDFQARIVTVRLNCQQSPAWRQAPSSGASTFSALNLADMRARQGCDATKVVAFEYAAGLRNHAVQHESMVFPVDHQHGRPHVDGIARVAALGRVCHP